MVGENAPRACDCGMPEKWAASSVFPVRFNSLLGNYGIVYGENLWHPMRYCFWCGGELPGIAKWEMFTPPAPNDVQSATEVTAQLSSLADVAKVLGEPDERWTPADLKASNTYSVMPFKQQWAYRRRWTSLDLLVIERVDGSVLFLLGGKYSGQYPQGAWMDSG